MKKPPFKYAAVAIVAIVYVLLWLAVGDLVGALVSLVVVALAFALLAAVVWYLASNVPHWWRYWRGVTPSQHLERLEKSGEAVREVYAVGRALTFEDHTTSGLVHLLDVGSGRVLCLHGQSYYDFEPIEDDPDSNQPRRFPTISFTLLRSTVSGEVLEIFPGNTIVNPVMGKPLRSAKQLAALGLKLVDGAILEGRTFEELEHAFR
jgi:hypothetical protein